MSRHANRSRDSARFGTVVLTGATSGIGEATAYQLAEIADTLILLGPETEEQAAPVLEPIRRTGKATVHYVSADFTRLDDVAAAADTTRGRVAEIDLLINDAGVPGAPARALTVDGFERTLQVNALAPALLTRLLVPSLSNGARIVNVGSSAHRVERFDFADIDLEYDYNPVAAYARAKLAMVTWSSLLAEELQQTNVTVVALCPGLNNTPLSVAMMGQIGGPPSEGASRVLHAATVPIRSGSYLEGDRPVTPSREVTDTANRGQLAQLFWGRLSTFTTRQLRDRSIPGHLA